MPFDADAVLDRRRLKRRLNFWRAAAALMAFAALVAVFLRTQGADDVVAELDIDGVITQDRERDRAIRELAEDDQVRAVLVRINSPGGSVTGSEELYLGLRAVAAKKPVVALVGTLGASGGYIAAIAADRVFVRETSLTGSIGALLQSVQVTGLLERLGIEPVTIKSAPLKGQPSPLEELTPEARATVQAAIDDSYRWFLDLVRERRGLAPAELAAVGDGRVLTGRQAVAAKLADALGGTGEARAWLAAEKGIPESLPEARVRYGDRDDPVDWLLGRIAGKVLRKEPLMLDGLLALWHP